MGNCFPQPDVADVQGNTLLHVACQNGNKRATRFLIKNGCNISATNHNMHTPLHYCYAYKYTDLAEYLEGKGADPCAVNSFGLVPASCLQHGLKPLQPARERGNSVPGREMIQANFGSHGAGGGEDGRPRGSRG